MSVHKHGTTGPGCAGTCCLKATDLGVSFGGEEVFQRCFLPPALRGDRGPYRPQRGGKELSFPYHPGTGASHRNH